MKLIKEHSFEEDTDGFKSILSQHFIYISQYVAK